MQSLTEQDEDAYRNFVSSLDSQESRRTYQASFQAFMRFCNRPTYAGMLQEMPVLKLESLIRDYIIHLRQDRKVSASTIFTYSAAISHFYEMNDVVINWRKLKKFKGRARKVIEDVPYTREQIRVLLGQASIRDSCLILLMASAGLRRGALPGLRLKDLTKIERFNLYKITVYKREQEQYITYCTPECAAVIDQYLNWRERLGERLEPTIRLFRKDFDITSPMRIARAQPITSGTITDLVGRLLDRTGVRPRTHTVNAKSQLMQCHGFRKFFDTQCISHNMNPVYCEYLMGHKTGLMKSYFKPSDDELLEGNDKSVGYIGVIPYLTINATEQENERLRSELQKAEIRHNEEWELMRQKVDEIREKMGLG